MSRLLHPLRVLPLLALLLSACGSSAAGPAGVLRLPLVGAHGLSDPATAGNARDIDLEGLLYSGLMKFSPDLHVIPELAVSLPTISDGGRAYTFTIRQDARFADGRPCTAVDVVYSLSRALSPGLHSALARRFLGGIVGARAVMGGESNTLSGVRPISRLTVRVLLSRPDARFLQELALPVAAVVEPSRYEPRVLEQGALPSGLGPFIVAGRAPGGALLLRPRPHAYEQVQQIHQVQLIPVDTPEAALSLYRKKALDAVWVPPANLVSFAQAADFHNIAGQTAYYAIPASPAPALAASLQRDLLFPSRPGVMEPLEAIVPPSVPDYVPGQPSASLPPSAAPWVAMEVPPHDAIAASLARGLRAQWRTTPGGVPVRIVRVWHDLPDPSVWLEGMAQDAHSSWYTRTLQRADRLTNDPVTRMTMYNAAEAWLLQRGLVIPLGTETTAFLIRSRVQGLQVTPLGLMPNNAAWSTVSLQ